jgi:hypothetical protein
MKKHAKNEERRAELELKDQRHRLQVQNTQHKESRVHYLRWLSG